MRRHAFRRASHHHIATTRPALGAHVDQPIGRLDDLQVQQAIANHRTAKKLMRAWEDETERLIDAEVPREL